MDRLAIPAGVLAAAVAHFRRCLPFEGVGFFAGPPGGPVTHWLPAANELASETRFRTEPRSALAAHKAMRAAGVDLVAVAHSHPTGPPTPSRHDIAGDPFDGAVLCVIVGLTADPPAVRAWRLGPGGVLEVEVVVT